MVKDITWVGIDAHKKTLQIAVFDGRSVVGEWEIANEPKGIQRLAHKLVRQAAGGELRCCYEAGPCGYASSDSSRPQRPSSSAKWLHHR